MALCVLLLIGIKAMFANGFGFQVAPFQMEVQMPGPGPFQSPFPQSSFSPLNLLSFPPIFNPLEAMGREAMDPEARGLDVDGPMGNVTTKNNTESKDGFKVTTITSDGPGFHSYIKEYEKEGNETTPGGGNSTRGPPVDIGKMLSSGKIFDIMNQLRNMGRKGKPAKCKKCGSGKFCDPIFHLCRKKFAEGRTCMAQKQCGKNLRCQWGKCQKAKKGDPGTFCKGNSQCNGDSCCRNTPGSFHLMCIPQQAEGAICGLHERTESVAKLFYVVKRSAIPSCSPCKSGLKCAETGGTRFKRCAKESYVEKASDELEDDNPSNAIDDDEGSADDKAKNGNPMGFPFPINPKKIPKTKNDKENKEDKSEDDEGDKENDKGDKDDDNDDKKDDKGDKDDDKDDKKDDKDDKKDDKDDKEDDKNDNKDDDNGIKNGDKDKGMDVQPAPKKKKGKGSGKGKLRRLKRCAKEAYIEKASDELEDDNPSNAINDDDEGSADDKEKRGNPLKGIPPKKTPTASENPIDDKNKDPKTKNDKEDKEDKNEDDQSDKDNDKDDKDNDKDESMTVVLDEDDKEDDKDDNKDDNKDNKDNDDDDDNDNDDDDDDNNNDDDGINNGENGKATGVAPPPEKKKGKDDKENDKDEKEDDKDDKKDDKKDNKEATGVVPPPEKEKGKDGKENDKDEKEDDKDEKGDDDDKHTKDDDEDEKDADKDEKKDDKKGDKEDNNSDDDGINNGDNDNGIDIQPPPKKKKGKRSGKGTL